MKITMNENDILEMIKSLYRFNDAKVKIEEGAVIIETNEFLPKPVLPMPNYAVRSSALPSDPTSVFVNQQKKSNACANRKDISELNFKSE